MQNSVTAFTNISLIRLGFALLFFDFFGTFAREQQLKHFGKIRSNTKQMNQIQNF